MSESSEGSSLACQGKDVDGGALTGPVPGRQAGHRGQAGRGIGVVPGQPLVEQAEGKAGAGGDGWGGAVRDSGCAWSRTPAASRVSPSAMASAASRKVTAAAWCGFRVPAGPT
jgi:hypothetical protein